jgi:hypothetical protein
MELHSPAGSALTALQVSGGPAAALAIIGL